MRRGNYTLAHIPKSFVSLIDGKQYNPNKFHKHLREHGLDARQYVELYILGYTPLCTCLAPLTFYQKPWGYAKSCGQPKCRGKSISDTKQNWSDGQRRADSEHKRIASVRMAPDVRELAIEKSKNTSMKRYGVPYVSQSDTQKEKSKATKLARYGNEYYNNSEKSAQANRSKTAEEQLIINRKRELTNVELYGIGNTAFLPKASSQSGAGNARAKPYTLPSGKIVQIRGYENLALDELLQEYDESDLVIHDWSSKYALPVFTYINTSGATSRYHPDFYIPIDNKIIEIKSKWWWDGDGQEKYKNRLINNLKKRQAVLDAGYEYEVWIYDCHSIKCEVLTSND